MGTNIALVVLMGLPGAGKSTLCETIADATKNHPELEGFSSIYVGYDDLIPLSSQEKFAEAKKTGTAEEETESWKGARHDVFVNVDRLINCLKMNDYEPTILNLFSVNRQCVENASNIAILLDDNFYYRSMRYEYFQLARKHTIGFCQVSVDVDVDVAVERNSRRTNKIPTSVIHSMAQKFQLPKPLENSWESSTFVVSSHKNLDGLWVMIRECMLSPVQPIENNEMEKEEARLICSKSVAHQADLYLRSLVGKVIKEAHAGGGGAKGNKEYAACVNAARQDIMVSIRKGSLLFPLDFAEVVDESNKKNFEMFIETEFRKNL